MVFFNIPLRIMVLQKFLLWILINSIYLCFDFILMHPALPQTKPKRIKLYVEKHHKKTNNKNVNFC